MTEPGFRLSRQSVFGLILSQALGLSIATNLAMAQAPAGTGPSLPTPISSQALVGLDMPPQMVVVVSKQALPTNAAPSNVTLSNNSNANSGQMADLINLYQEAAFSDPVLNAARFNYQASKELYWQGLSLLLPQANATPGGTRYYQHGQGTTTVATGAGNSRVFDQKSYTVTYNPRKV